jgi:uncharacterized membrane protein (DUF106 family)
MNAFNKTFFVLLIAFTAVASLNLYANLAAASPDVTFQISVSASNYGVALDASYTFTVTNSGNASLSNLNITIPAGYSNVKTLAVSQQTWSITSDPAPIQSVTPEQPATIRLTQTGQGLSSGQSLTFTLEAKNPQVAGTYTWVAQGLGSDNSTSSVNINSEMIITSIVPALEIVGIALGIAFLNTAINRVLINYFVGWEQYRVMQKEMAEFRQEQMAAARANDKKQLEKLKRKQSQITNMQSKMMKPQIVQFGISFVYLIVWFLVLTPTFQNISMAYLPGIGPIPVFYLYPLVSVFLGLISQRLLDIMPIEQR